jgi:hypothetical protein
MEDTRLTLAGQHMKTIGDASSAFIRDNYTSIINRLNEEGAELLRIDVNDDLIAEGYLPAGYSNTNPFRQTLCTLVRQQSTPSGRIVLEGLLVTEGGDELDDISIALMASQAGSAGGAFYEDPLDPEGTGADIFGVLGGWNLAKSTFEHDNIGFDPSVTTSSNCSGTSGQVLLEFGHAVQALWMDDTVNTTAFLYRDDVGDPLFNTMNTDLHMGGNFIDGLVQVSAGDACMQAQPAPPAAPLTGPDYAEEGAIANTSDGGLLVCRDSLWQSIGIPVYDKYSDLPTPCTDDDIAVIKQSGEAEVLGIPDINGKPRFFMCQSNTWMPTGVDEIGGLDVRELRAHSTINNSGPTQGITVIAGTPDFSVACTPGTITTTRTGSIMECIAEIDPDDATFDCGNDADGYPFGSKAIAANDSSDGTIKAGEPILCVSN